MTCGIYKIKNNVNGKMYIGQSVDIEGRWKRHQYDSKTKDSHFYKAIRKHGLDNFVFSIICECPESALDEYEISYIKYYETTDRTKGYNLMSGGSNGRHSDETKKKISEANKGKLITAETKKKMSDAQKGHKHNLGNTHSDIAKKKMSDAQKGKLITDETKKKISDAQKGKLKTVETKKKMSDARKNMTEETKQKMSESKRKQYIYNDVGYIGMKDLADFLGISYVALNHKIRRKQIDVTILAQSAENRPS